MTWHEEPGKWEPINHSCDPNTWLHGLNTYARRDIKRAGQRAQHLFPLLSFTGAIFFIPLETSEFPFSASFELHSAFPLKTQIFSFHLEASRVPNLRWFPP